jgi:hypothetical protein
MSRPASNRRFDRFERTGRLAGVLGAEDSDYRAVGNWGPNKGVLS